MSFPKKSEIVEQQVLAQQEMERGFRKEIEKNLSNFKPSSSNSTTIISAPSGLEESRVEAIAQELRAAEWNVEKKKFAPPSHDGGGPFWQLYIS